MWQGIDELIDGQHRQYIFTIILLDLLDDGVVTRLEPIEVHQLGALAVNIVLTPVKSADRSHGLDGVARQPARIRLFRHVLSLARGSQKVRIDGA